MQARNAVPVRSGEECPKIGAATNQGSTYIAPARSGPGTPVLLLHAWWGLSQPIKDLADRLASDGFTVLAPDLFDGVVLTTVEEAETHGHEMDAEYERIIGRVEASFDELLAHPDARGDQAAAIALSFGGWYAAQVAKARPEITALVMIYSDVFQAPDGTAYLGHFAASDQFVDSDAPDLLEARKRGDAHVYPGTEHWFMENDQPEHNAEAAELAYTRTIDFLRQQLA